MKLKPVSEVVGVFRSVIHKSRATVMLKEDRLETYKAIKAIVEGMRGCDLLATQSYCTHDGAVDHVSPEHNQLLTDLKQELKTRFNINE